MEASMKHILKIRNIISITVLNLIRLQNLDLSKYLIIDYSNLKKLPVVYITKYQKENNESVHYGNFSFHWLEIEQIEKNFDRGFKIWIEHQKKNNEKQTRNLICLFLVSIVYVSYVGTIQLNWLIGKFHKHNMVPIYKMIWKLWILHSDWLLPQTLPVKKSLISSNDIKILEQSMRSRTQFWLVDINFIKNSMTIEIRFWLGDIRKDKMFLIMKARFWFVDSKTSENFMVTLN